MKRKIMGMAILAAMVLGCMTGCSGNTDSAVTENSTGNSVTADKTSSVVENQEDSKQEQVLEPNKPNPNGDVNGDDIYMNSIKLIPVGTVTNSGINFGEIKIRNKKVDIFATSSFDIVRELKWSYNRRPFAVASQVKFDFPDFSFYGNVYTHGIHLEYLENDMVIVIDQTEEPRIWETPCTLKGLEWSVLEADFEHENYDYLEFYEDITLGTPKEEVIELLGEGIQGTPFTVEYTDETIEYQPVIYKSETTTMVIMYQNMKNRESVPIVGRVFVLKNN